jgi:RNA polymerase sigma-70 factor (family 1)
MLALNKFSDEELIPLLRADDHGAFNEIYERYKGILVIHACKKLDGDLEDAKEIVQEVFSNFWHNRHALPGINVLKAYLYTLVRNRVLNYIQHQDVVTRYADSFSRYEKEYDYSTDRLIREKQMLEIIDREINALPAKMKEVFLLSRKNYLSHKEIAEKLEISEHTVKNHIKSALKILRNRLDLVLIIVMLRHY